MTHVYVYLDELEGELGGRDGIGVHVELGLRAHICVRRVAGCMAGDDEA